MLQRKVEADPCLVALALCLSLAQRIGLVMISLKELGPFDWRPPRSKAKPIDTRDTHDDAADEKVLRSR
jgi:hypothetical protein